MLGTVSRWLLEVLPMVAAKVLPLRRLHFPALFYSMIWLGCFPAAFFLWTYFFSLHRTNRSSKSGWTGMYLEAAVLWLWFTSWESSTWPMQVIVGRKRRREWFIYLFCFLNYGNQAMWSVKGYWLDKDWRDPDLNPWSAMKIPRWLWPSLSQSHIPHRFLMKMK